MSLATDSIFITALQSNTDLLEALGYVEATETSEGNPARLYGTAIPLPDEDADNVPVPYVIVTFDGLTNDQGTKDDRYESNYDTVNIGVEVAARNINELHDLTQMVRDTILGYLRANETAIMDYNFAAQPIQFDSLKPCYWQTLTYQCDVINTNDDEQEDGSNSGI
jgi:hypothetical protein